MYYSQFILWTNSPEETHLWVLCFKTLFLEKKKTCGSRVVGRVMSNILGLTLSAGVIRSPLPYGSDRILGMPQH